MNRKSSKNTSSRVSSVQRSTNATLPDIPNNPIPKVTELRRSTNSLISETDNSSAALVRIGTLYDKRYLTGSRLQPMHKNAPTQLRRRFRKAGQEVQVAKTGTPGRMVMQPTPPTATKPSVSRPRGKSAGVGKRITTFLSESSDSVASVGFSIAPQSTSSNLDIMNTIDERLSDLQEKLSVFAQESNNAKATILEMEADQGSINEAVNNIARVLSCAMARSAMSIFKTYK